MSIEFSDEVLSSMWETVDFKKAREKLDDLQKKLSLAAGAGDNKKIEYLQKKIVRDIDIKCLAVRHVVLSTSGPGVDGVRWRTQAQMMSAALSLTSRGYHAQPLRQIIIIAKNSGKERRPRLPTFYDRAMGVLYGYTLLPVIETLGERKSFAFRPGRSVHDAHAYVCEALNGVDAPKYVVYGDIKAYYSRIQHSWLLSHVPMDRKVLSEFLHAGFVFAGELFPAEDVGISEGSNLSPYLGNFVLDGLQKHIYKALHGTDKPVDFSDGNLIRYADDVIITARSRDSAKKILEAIQNFLDERGLKLSEEKTGISRVDEGFTFLARTYIKKNGYMHSCPANDAVERFIENLKNTIEENKKSQRELILLLNRKLSGWANYYRFCDAHDAFHKVEVALQTALLDEARKKHPKMQFKKLKSMYWYEEFDGRHAYALPDDKSIRVMHISDILCISHKKVKTNLNPFLDTKYMEQRTQHNKIQNVTGRYKAIWKRQNGRCFYCGRPILRDQERTVVQADLTKKPCILNQAYIHTICLPNEFEIIKTIENVDILRTYDFRHILEKISNDRKKAQRGKRAKSQITPRWKYFKLKEYFSDCTLASLTLSFEEIENIIKNKLPDSARKKTEWWYPRNQTNRIAEAWITEGYTMTKIDITKEKASFKRDEPGKERVKIPEVLLDSKIPADAVYELETHMSYIISKYGLY